MWVRVSFVSSDSPWSSQRNSTFSQNDSSCYAAGWPNLTRHNAKTDNDIADGHWSCSILRPSSCDFTVRSGGDRQMSGSLAVIRTVRTWPTSANQDRCSQSSHCRHDHCLVTDSCCSATGSVIVFWLFCLFHLTLLAVTIASSATEESRRPLLRLLVSCSCRRAVCQN